MAWSIFSQQGFSPSTRSTTADAKVTQMRFKVSEGRWWTVMKEFFAEKSPRSIGWQTLPSNRGLDSDGPLSLYGHVSVRCDIVGHQPIISLHPHIHHVVCWCYSSYESLRAKVWGHEVRRHLCWPDVVLWPLTLARPFHGLDLWRESLMKSWTMFLYWGRIANNDETIKKKKKQSRIYFSLTYRLRQFSQSNLRLLSSSNSSVTFTSVQIWVKRFRLSRNSAVRSFLAGTCGYDPGNLSGGRFVQSGGVGGDSLFRLVNVIRLNKKSPTLSVSGSASDLLCLLWTQ